MKHQFDPRRFVVRERYKLWSDMQRKHGGLFRGWRSVFVKNAISHGSFATL